MEIHTNNRKNSYLRKVKNKVFNKRLFLILLVLLGLIGFGLTSVIYGAYLNSTGRTYNLKFALHQISNFNFSFIPNTVKGQMAEVKQLDIDVKFKNWERIRYNREMILAYGGEISSDLIEEIPAKINFNNQSYKVKIKVKVDRSHIIQPTKWGLMVKVLDGKTIMGMRKFALLYPESRGYLTDWIASKLLQSRGIIGLRSGFSKIKINGGNNELYYIEERFDKEILDNNHLKEGLVFRSIEKNLKIYDFKKTKENQKKLENIILLKKLWDMFLIDSIRPEQLFDLKKYASLCVISDIMYSTEEAHALFYHNSRMYFNPITLLIEPIPREWGDLREDKRKPLENLIIENRIPDHFVILKRITDNLLFKELYLKEAEKLSKKSYLDSVLIVHKKEIDILTSEIHSQNPFYKLPINILYENQKVILEKIHPVSPLIEVYFDSVTKNNDLILSVNNKTNFPLEIKRLIYNDSKIILPDKRIIIYPKFQNEEDYQSILIPLNLYDEIDINKFSSDSLEIVNTILGIKEIDSDFYGHTVTSKTIVLPKRMSKSDYLRLNTANQSSNVMDFECITILKKDKIIEFSHEVCEIDKDLIIPKGFTVKTKPGVIINLTNSAKIISYSPVLFFGKKDSPITIMSSDLTGQGILVLNNDHLSEMSYVNFKSLSNISEFGWELSGVITFYESPVNIINCNFVGNIRGADYLSLIRTNFNVLNTTFENTYDGAFNSDYSTGKIENVKFNEIGADAIKTIGSNLQIEEVQITNLKGTGINSGQNSHLICENLAISGGEISVLSKDNTLVEINKISIDSSDLAYSAFQEKSNYGPATIKVTDASSHNVQNNFLIETGSSLSINGTTIYKRNEKVKEILYGAKNTKTTE